MLKPKVALHNMQAATADATNGAASAQENTTSLIGRLLFDSPTRAEYGGLKRNLIHSLDGAAEHHL